MCGIAGWLGIIPDDKAAANVLQCIKHRGPDSDGIWQDVSTPITLLHSRLSILDLSANGHQPMTSSSGRYVISFNGEIYNHLELRKKLNGFEWRGLSDTETLLGAIEMWGMKITLSKLRGMFAFGLWDRQKKVLSLCRDRIGEKPLYYWVGKRGFFFASELSAFRENSVSQLSIDKNSVALYMKHGCVPGSKSIYENVKKLLPGEMLSIGSVDHKVDIEKYFIAEDLFRLKSRCNFSGFASSPVEELEDLLIKSVRMQMVADVPVGVFLSGGIDSSTVAAVMQSQNESPVNTFSIGFDDPSFDEAPFAREVAKHIGSNHTEVYLDSKAILELIPSIPTIYSEPFADSSQLPTFIVSEVARKQVKVCLSGDGGDELFGGYNRYLLGHKLWRILEKIPVSFRLFVARIITSASPKKWDSIIKSIEFFLPRFLLLQNAGDKFHKASGAIVAINAQELYEVLISHWQSPTELVLNSTVSFNDRTQQIFDFFERDFVHAMMASDLVGYLPDDLLTKVDRASMAVGLETRLPLLDHQLVNFAWSLPMDLKIRNGKTKWILREVLAKYVPTEMIDRPKMGFGVPIASWLRGPLREWGENLLDEKLMTEQNILNTSLVQKYWSEHLSGERNWHQQLWNVLMFQAWIAHER